MKIRMSNNVFNGQITSRDSFVIKMTVFTPIPFGDFAGLLSTVKSIDVLSDNNEVVETISVECPRIVSKLQNSIYYAEMLTAIPEDPKIAALSDAIDDILVAILEV